jgi:serine/threonine protein kinase
VEIAQTIDHPNITKFIDFYEEETAFCLVYELMVGGEVSH